MSSFRSRARRLAFGDSSEKLSDANSTHSSVRSSSSSIKERPIRYSSSISIPDSHDSHASEKMPVLVTPRRTSRVRRVHRSQHFEHFVEAIEQDGCVIIEDFVSPQISQRVQNIETASIEQQLDDTEPYFDTIDVNSLIRESLVSDLVFQTLSSHFLTLERISWQNRDIDLKSTKPHVSSSYTSDLSQTEVNIRSFHRGDGKHHTQHTASSKYEYQPHRDTNLGLLVPEIDSLSSSISVKVIPGSHLWDDQEPDTTRGVKEVQLKSGDALIMLGSMYHEIPQATAVLQGRNISPSKSQKGSMKQKLLHEIWMCSGIYRPADEIESDDEDN